MKLRCTFLLLALLTACAPMQPIPEPPSADQLLHDVPCPFHIADPWRRIEARAFRGRVVTRHDREAYPGAMVALRKRGGKKIRKIYSDDAGRFHIPDLTEGTYEFVACAEGMDPDTGWLTISHTAAEGEVELLLRYGV